MTFTKAIVFDLDGTAIPNQAQGMPSAAVVAMVRKLSQTHLVTFATGRPLPAATPIAKALGISVHCIVTGGAEVIRPDASSRLYYQPLDETQFLGIVSVLSQYDYPVLSDGFSKPISTASLQLKSPLLHLCVLAVSESDAVSIINALSVLKGLVVHRVNSWTEGCFDLHLTHPLATKRHGLNKLLEHYQIDGAQTLVIGDSGNDLPMFEVAGLSIAMGNASDVVKTAADWVAPSVAEDGLVAAVAYAQSTDWGKS